MSKKQCNKCGLDDTEYIIIRYPTGELDKTVNLCDPCALEARYKFN